MKRCLLQIAIALIIVLFLPSMAQAQFQDDPGVDTCLGTEDPFCSGTPTTTGGSGGSTSCMTCYQKGRLATCSGKFSCTLLAFFDGGSCRGEGTGCKVEWYDGNAYCDFSGGCSKSLIRPAATVPDSLWDSFSEHAEEAESESDSAWRELPVGDSDS